MQSVLHCSSSSLLTFRQISPERGILGKWFSSEYVRVNEGDVSNWDKISMDFKNIGDIDIAILVQKLILHWQPGAWANWRNLGDLYWETGQIELSLECYLEYKQLKKGRAIETYMKERLKNGHSKHY